MRNNNGTAVRRQPRSQLLAPVVEANDETDPPGNENEEDEEVVLTAYKPTNLKRTKEQLLAISPLVPVSVNLKLLLSVIISKCFYIT